MADFNDKVFVQPYQEGDQNYFSGANFAPSVGTEKNNDQIDEKVSEDQIQEIPRYDVIARTKARKEYNAKMEGFKYYKKKIESNLKKLDKINTKLEKHATYPDEAFGRDKLMKEKYKLEQEVSEWSNIITTVSKEKIRIYGKALGLPRKPDSFFEVIPNNKKISSVIDYVNEFNKKDNNKKSSDDLDKQEVELPPISDANKIYEEVKNENSQIDNEVEKALEKQEEVSLNIDEQLYNLYTKFEKKYGKENVEKFFSKALYDVLYDNKPEKPEINNHSTIVNYDTSVKSDAELIYENAELNSMLNDNNTNSINDVSERNK